MDLTDPWSNLFRQTWVFESTCTGHWLPSRADLRREQHPLVLGIIDWHGHIEPHPPDVRHTHFDRIRQHHRLSPRQRTFAPVHPQEGHGIVILLLLTGRHCRPTLLQVRCKVVPRPGSLAVYFHVSSDILERRTRTASPAQPFWRLDGRAGIVEEPWSVAYLVILDQGG